MSGVDTGAPALRLQGVIKTAQPGTTTDPFYTLPNRGVLHADSVFAASGDNFLSSSWENLPPP